MLTKHPLATCLEQHTVSCVCWVCQYCNWACNWYFTTPWKQLHAFCSALQMTPVVVKWNYNYRLLCLKTCNHYVVIAFVVFQLLQPWYTPTYVPMTIPICLRAMKTENTVVRSFLVVVRAKSPKMAAPAPAPTPEEKCPALTACYIPRFTQQTNECYTS